MISVSETGKWLSPWISPSAVIAVALAAQPEHELHVVDDADDQHADAERHQRDAEIARRGGVRDQSLLSAASRRTWKIVKPKPISDSEVRITDISVRSALMRVRWNDMPVRRAASSVEISSGIRTAT